VQTSVSTRIETSLPRVTFVAQAPTPYITPILNELSTRVDLDVLFFKRPARGARRNDAWSEFEDPWGEPPEFRYQFGRSLLIHDPRSDFHAQVALGSAWRALRKHDPAAIVIQSWGPLVLEPLLWASLHGRARVLWTESHQRSGLVRSWISNAIRRVIVSRADAIVSNGTEATAYVCALGVDPARVITSCLPSSLRQPTPRRINPRHGNVRFLFVGRLIPLKRASLAIQAFGELVERRTDVELVVVGSGPEERALRAQAASYGNSVRFAGRLERAALHQAYADADVLLVPSAREVWGLVVNEALAAGAYVVASAQVASAADLLDRHSGELVPEGDSQAWFDAVARAADVDQSDMARAHRRARVADCTPARFADDLVDGIQRALRRSSTPDRHR
jgi:glycosyltransferase involved in cell wall biosynthesis